jgi:hypothetical protein
MYFHRSELAKAAGYFSRRHRTGEAHQNSREGLKVRSFTPDIHRKPADQIKLLDQRLGVGVGAVKERAKLARRINGAA